VLDKNNQITTYGPISENGIGHLEINENTNRGYLVVGDIHGKFIEILVFDLANPENILSSIKNQKFGYIYPLYISEKYELILFNFYQENESVISFIDIQNESNTEVGNFPLDNRYNLLRGFDEENQRIY